MMLDKRSSLLLIIIFAVGLVYRLLLTTLNIFPPGADIGLHESVINSITAPKTTFLYNYYHMGGGLSATNPGYHIFASFIITMTGAPDYLVQALIASLFSALIILCAFMVVRLVWGEFTGIIVAVLVTFSASDILMLSWAGYPNIVALVLIPVLFYLFLQPKPSPNHYRISAALIVSALFLTHLFSGIIFMAITITALVAAITFKSTGLTIKSAVVWLIPIFFGITLVSPYLISIFPVYFGPEGAITGSVSVIKQAVVETRIVSSVTSVLAVVPILLFLVISKKEKGKFFTLPSVLFASAILVPLAGAQCYLFGFFLDYERFLYFLTLPVLVCIGIILVKATNVISDLFSKLKHLKTGNQSSNVKVRTVLLSVLVGVCLLTPLFALPNVGLAQANYFQVMNPTKYEAIKWVQTNTPVDSVCVADAEFGWWLSGFAKRPTLSAVDPQFLILQREFEPALVASNLLKGDYWINNGFMQVEQVGRYANVSSHDFYAVLNDSIIKPLAFSLNDTQASLLYRDNGSPEEMKLEDFVDSNTQVANDGNSTSLIISRESSLFRITEEITVFKGVRFAEVTFVFQTGGNINFDWIRIPFKSSGCPLQYGNSIGIVDSNMHMVNQIVLPEGKPGKDMVLQQNADYYELVCNLNGHSTIQLNFHIGLCPFEESEIPQTDYIQLIRNNAENFQSVVSDGPITSFDYQSAIYRWKISYIVAIDFDNVRRFSNDPTFRLAFKNDEVAVFQVVRTLN
jgi:hypothetical protein